MMQEIENADLDLSRVPLRSASIGEIWNFALTFHGYKRAGSFEACAEIANSRRHDTLTDLRTCLFFEQRRWRHFGEAPNGADLDYIRQLVEAIRQKIEKVELD